MKKTLVTLDWIFLLRTYVDSTNSLSLCMHDDFCSVYFENVCVVRTYVHVQFV